METTPNTHLSIDHSLCGEAVDMREGWARVRLEATDQMAVDEHGLVHGGFVFGLADYAAMLAVNDPNVVLGGAQVSFVAPIEVGDEVVATAEVGEENGKKRVVEASASVGDTEVFRGTFTAFVLPKHILED